MKLRSKVMELGMMSPFCKVNTHWVDKFKRKKNEYDLDKELNCQQELARGKAGNKKETMKKDSKTSEGLEIIYSQLFEDYVTMQLGS